MHYRSPKQSRESGLEVAGWWVVKPPSLPLRVVPAGGAVASLRCLAPRTPLLPSGSLEFRVVTLDPAQASEEPGFGQPFSPALRAGIHPLVVSPPGVRGQGVECTESG